MLSTAKPLVWISSSKKDLMTLPGEVRRFFGYALRKAQEGERHDAAKVLAVLVYWKLWKTMREERIAPSTQFDSSKLFSCFIVFKRKARAESLRRRKRLT